MDLGVGREMFDGNLRRELEKERELELQKQKQQVSHMSDDSLMQYVIVHVSYIIGKYRKSEYCNCLKIYSLLIPIQLKILLY